MPIITQIELQKKNKGRFSIFLDGKFAFGADADLVVNFRLIPGKIIEDKDLEKLIFESEIGKLMGRIYNLFLFRQRSEKEVRDYFKIKNSKLKIQNGEEISDLVIELLISRLREKGLIDDFHFAQAWVESRRKSKQKGVNALKMELFQKGIDKEIVEEVISSQSSAVREEELAKLALEKKMRVWKNLEPQEFKKKATDFLLRRGFEYSIIKKILIEFD